MSSFELLRDVLSDSNLARESAEEAKTVAEEARQEARVLIERLDRELIVGVAKTLVGTLFRDILDELDHRTSADDAPAPDAAQPSQPHSNRVSDLVDTP